MWVGEWPPSAKQRRCWRDVSKAFYKTDLHWPGDPRQSRTAGPIAADFKAAHVLQGAGAMAVENEGGENPSDDNQGIHYAVFPAFPS